ncbi:MAG: hypothetical protein V4754_20200 [Pseudomonadota bacterium]
MSTSNASVGVGRENDSSKAGTQDGSQQATGGSGPVDNQQTIARHGQAPTPGDSPAQRSAEGAATAVTASNRGAQDTRSAQAGGTGTGLGSGETGANQTPADVSPNRQ